jgi:enediyne biosynthesis protein E4
VYPEIEVASPGTHYKQHNSLFHNEMNGKFVETSAAAGLTALPARAGRGVAFADFDNDGFVDMVVSNDGDPPTLLHNSGNNGNHFVNFKLVGTKSNREIMGGGSYLSQSDLRANFGLGKNTAVQSVEVTWPSGGHQVFHDVKVDKFYLIDEGRNE